MPDRILKPDSGNDLILQNDDATAKIEINEDGSIPMTGTLSGSVDVSSGSFTSSLAQKQAIVQGGPGSGTLDVSSGTFTSSSAQKQAIVQAGPGSGTFDVSSGTFTSSSAQKQAIVQAGPGTGTFDVSSGTFTSSTAQKTAILAGGAFPAGHVLQVKSVRSVTGTAWSGGSSTQYMKSDGAGWQTTEDYTISLTTKQANSNFLINGMLQHYTKSADAAGNQITMDVWVGTSGTSNASYSYTNIISLWLDARATNGGYGNESRPMSGTALIDLSVSAGTAYYFNFKTTYVLSNIYLNSDFTVMEIAV